MKKVALLAVIAAVTMSVSAQAETVRNTQKVASNKSDQCWIATDLRGYGYWMGCGNLTQAQRAQLNRESLAATEGGGGGGGGGGK